MSFLTGALGLVAAYLIGAIPTGLMVGLAFAGTDIRRHGSKNIGFTNALRVLGPKLGIPVLIVDVGKAWLAVWLVPQAAFGTSAGVYPVLCAAAVMLGNMLNVLLGFKGGKGVAAAMGVFLALAPLPTLGALGAFVAVLAVTRYVSLGSIVAALVLPGLTLLLNGWGALFLITVLTGVGVIVKHRANVRRLLDGTESRLGSKEKPPAPA